MSRSIAGMSAAEELAVLRSLARQYPSVDAALAEMARLSAILTLPKGTVHIISDVHGEYGKLRHVINNASGTLRPHVERLFAGRLPDQEWQQFLALLFYPYEVIEDRERSLANDEERRVYYRRILRLLFELIRALARDVSMSRVLRLLPANYRDVLQELLYERSDRWWTEYNDAVVDTLMDQAGAADMIHSVVRTIRNLVVDELIIAGDLWDRGPRGDRVVDYLRRQPNVAMTWGNHDAAWLGASLGHEALIAHVLRISLRYRRLAQLEEGYGILIQPLEILARKMYGDDPAACFMPHGTGIRDVLQMARMQKAAAVMQFKLEGQLMERNPEFQMQERRLLHRIDHARGTIEIDGKPRVLKDRFFPTIDQAQPYELSPEEKTCLTRIRQSFLSSAPLAEHMRYLVQRGRMYLVRDHHLVFHGCIPVEKNGAFQEFPLDGVEFAGKDLFDAIERVVVRAFDKKAQKDLDILWYLWCGPRSPLFGKDRITTLENDLLDDPTCKVEAKNPYFHLLDDPAFCARILKEFGVDPSQGLIVNGHVPVKIDKGESPVKKSGMAITIDGAFSEAYGDHGYTLVLEPDKTVLARHHHFESVEAAVRDGVDIIPAVQVVKQWDRPRRVADTERGVEIRAELTLLAQLVEAYRSKRVAPTS
jgi:fructose-1,6-bisphosphatase III